MTLTPEQRAVLETRLTEAENAYHQLAMGQAARVFVDQNGERIEYVAANANRLQTYITSLKYQLGVQRIAGPMQIWF